MRLSGRLGRIWILAWAGGIPGGSMVPAADVLGEGPLDSEGGGDGGPRGGERGAKRGPRAGQKLECLIRLADPHLRGCSCSRRRRWFWQRGEPDSGSPATFQRRPGGPVSPLDFCTHRSTQALAPARGWRSFQNKPSRDWSREWVAERVKRAMPDADTV